LTPYGPGLWRLRAGHFDGVVGSVDKGLNDGGVGDEVGDASVIVALTNGAACSAFLADTLAAAEGAGIVALWGNS
jgi:hypothetical protein